MNLLASDFDGTLLIHKDKDAFYRDSDLDKIVEFQKAGNLFGLCTGRDVLGVYHPSQDKVIYDFLITSSGAIILDKNKNIIFQNLMKRQTIQDVIDYMGDDKCYSFSIDSGMYFMNLIEQYKDAQKIIHSFDELENQEFNGFSIHYDSEEEAHVDFLKIKDKFKDEFEVYQNIDNLDFVATGCSKGNGLTYIQKHFNLTKDQMHVIGDSYNDYPMFEACKNSFTFNHVSQEVQNHTKHQVKDVRECIEVIMKE